jgi:hypothetical protein
MDNKFLNKVLDQIVRETEIDYDEERLYTPYLSILSPTHHTHSFSHFTPLPLLPPLSFSKHCKEVYGLNDNEMEYVWEEYKEIIRDNRLYNNG